MGTTYKPVEAPANLRISIPMLPSSIALEKLLRQPAPSTAKQQLGMRWDAKTDREWKKPK
jgi:hypothetical protein